MTPARSSAYADFLTPPTKRQGGQRAARQRDRRSRGRNGRRACRAYCGAMSDKGARICGRACVVALLAVAGVVVYLLVRRDHEQPELPATVVPIARGAKRSRTYVDCTKVSTLAYFADNPCETFVLIHGSAEESARSLLTAESETLATHGWRHPALRPLVDYDHYDRLAPKSEAWFSRDPRACVYVTIAKVAVRQLASSVRFGNTAADYRAFYDALMAADAGSALFVRLRPPEMAQPKSCND